MGSRTGVSGHSTERERLIIQWSFEPSDMSLRKKADQRIENVNLSEVFGFQGLNIG